MVPKRRLQETVQANARALREALKAEVKRLGFRQADLEAALGRPQGHFSHVFAGRVKLGVEQVFEVLAVIGVEPGEFFARTFPPPSGAGGGGEPSIKDLEATFLRALRRLAKEEEGEGRESAAF